MKEEDQTRHILSVSDLTTEELKRILKITEQVKKKPKKYRKVLENKTLLMIFQAPSLRTRISFEVAMNQLGGSALNYDLQGSPLIKGKESLEDTARVISRYADAACLRIYDHKELEKFAHFSKIHIINAMTNLEHPCQVLGDLFTIYERNKKLNKLKMSYLGDCNNNVTNSLLLGCALVGMNISLACPKNKDFIPDEGMLNRARDIGRKTGADIEVYQDPKKAVSNADVIYTDSWMSYRIDEKKKAERIKALQKYKVTKDLLNKAQEHALFMHCLPASRGEEVTDDVMDSKQSIVLDQAENRLHVQKALLLGMIR